MSSRSRSKAEKKKRREREIRRERNLRRNLPRARDDVPDDFDIDRAIEELPAELQIERVMRRIARATGKRRFASEAEALQDVEALGRPGSEAAFAEFRREDPRDGAEDLAYLALHRENALFSRDLATTALELDPECIDALAIIAVYEAETPEERVDGLERVLATGVRALGGPAFFAENRGYFWTDVLTRPYMRARRMLANGLYLRRDLDAAAAHFEALLELDPEDHLEIRDTLLGIRLVHGDLVRARALLEPSRASGSPVEPWARVLERWLSGDRRGAAQAVRVARASNGLVEEALVDPESLDVRERELELDENLDALESDAVLDAELVAMRLGRAWIAHSDALAWLESGAPSSTEEERRVAITSFTPRVSKLFELGRIEHDKPWIEYMKTCGLVDDDVPELIRMATDPALHELETEPDAWAPAHAWRALGEMRAESAVDPLLALTNEQREDDGFLADLPHVLARIGPNSFAPVIAWMSEHRGDELRQCIAYEAIVKIVGTDQVLRARALKHLGDELDRSPEREDHVNGWLISALIDLRAIELAPRIRRAFDAGDVDPTIAGDWSAVRDALGAAERE